MATLGDLEGQMTAIQGQLGQYSQDLPSQIQSQVQKAWTPSLEGAVGATEKQMQQYVPQYFQMGETLGGTTAADLSPTQKLGQMGNVLGNMVGRLTATQKVSDYLGAQMNDMYSRALQAAELGKAALSEKYTMLADQYKLAWQEIENQKDRDLQAKLSAGSGSGSAGLGDWFVQAYTDEQERLAYESWQNEANKVANMVGNSGPGNVTSLAKPAAIPNVTLPTGSSGGMTLPPVQPAQPKTYFNQTKDNPLGKYGI